MALKLVKKKKNITKNTKNKAKTTKTTAKKVQKVLSAFILDKSGSMFVRQQPTIDGFNEYLQTLKDDQGADYLFNLTLFDTDVTTPYTGEPLVNVAKLGEATYKPAGNTALYDALGTTIRKIEESLTSTKVDKVLVVVLTDGQENSSSQYSRERIFKLIKEKEALGTWTFVYLGCDKDAYAAGMNLGIAPGNTFKYNPTDLKGTMHYVGATSAAYSSSDTSNTSDISKFGPASKSVRNQSGTSKQ